MDDFCHATQRFFTDLPQFLREFVAEHGVWVYGLLFGIIFAETGLVLLPFLPGDSLLFTVGALSAPTEKGPPVLNIWLVAGLLVAAAILGDAVNYHAGRLVGPRVFSKQPSPNPTFLERSLNRRHLERASAFFEKYGGKAVILGRFVPIVRTFVPFVAGAGAMNYSRFFLYNVAGAFLWVGVCCAAGYFFGNFAVVQKNFELVIVGIIVVSVLPVAYEIWKARGERVSPVGP
jgi:membrane-associated protein